MRRVLIALAMIWPAACVMPEDTAEPDRVRPRVVTAEPVRAVDAAWAFSFGQGTCTASISHPSAGITLSLGPAPNMNLTSRVVPVPGRGAATRVAFNGAGGSWALRLRRTPHSEAAAAVALNPAAEGWVRALLTGGTLRLTSGSSAVAVLTVPDSGVAGRDWFGCVTQLGA